ncbi:MAG: sporulation transcriptional regulator SpoIIID [Eubacteriales bacterium]|nr:sporulation transcriptional regulator SpoIIID [Eubacteriales bacterium]
MLNYTEERVYAEAHYMIDNCATVRDTATVLKSSKSTVHKDVTSRLKRLNPNLAAQVRRILDVNKAERHIRGGQATCRKYKHLKDN